MPQRTSFETPSGNTLDQVGFTLKVTISIGIFSLLVASILTGIYSTLNDKQRDVFNFGASAFGVCIAGASAFHAYRGIIENYKFQKEETITRKEEKILDRTIDYIGRWNHPDYIQHKAIMHEIAAIVEGDDNQSIIDYLRDKPLKIQEATGILNFLEEMSFLIYKDIVDKDMACIFYRGIIIRCYKLLFPFMVHRRDKTNNPRLYEQFERLYFEWKDINENGNSNTN